MKNTDTPLAIFWHRRDLRLNDNKGLYFALKSGLKVLPLFIFDTDILNKLENKKDARVEFIQRTLTGIKGKYEDAGSSILVKVGKPLDIFSTFLREYNIKAVYANTDYEPYARERDAQITDLLKANGVAFHTFKDHVIFEKDEVMKADGSPYTVYTPYMKRWKDILHGAEIETFDIKPGFGNLYKTEPFTFPELSEIGFEGTQAVFPDAEADLEIIRNYHLLRNLPSVKGTTRLGLHLRFGTVSIRKLVKLAIENNETWLNELIWREFFQMILYHFPHTDEKSFKPAYDQIEWINNEEQFKAWCEGKSGFPIVDAGMRELSETGFMHNRVRMIAGSFLVKDLLIDWRWGEAWFAEKLLDYEQASNVGNWQWFAGSGCDAAPYFRVFNPDLQAKKFDPNGEYIRRWLPEYGTPDYPEPIVDHAFAKERALKAYKSALQTF